MSERNQDSDYARQGARKTRSSEEQERWEDERTEEIQQYLKERYARRDVAAQTRTASGQLLDWVPRESQAGAEPLAYPPEEDGPPTYVEDDRRAEALPFELQQSDAELGPEGTVPVVRKPIEEIPAWCRSPGLAGQGHPCSPLSACRCPPRLRGTRRQ